MSAKGTGNLVKIDGRMNAAMYQDILAENLHASVKKLSMGRSWIFQQDNDPKHKAKSTTQWFKKKRVKVLEWPSQSPDLNIIEPLWGELKRRVHARQPNNLQVLESFCYEEWAKISPRTIQKLVQGYPKRLQAVIDAQGGNTKY